MYENDPRYLSPPPRSTGMGCLAKGCLTLLAVGVVLGVMVGAGSWYLVRGFAPFLDQRAATIRVSSATDEEYQAVMDKVGPFIQSANAGHAATLSLSTDEVDTLIARDPQLADLRGKLFLARNGSGKITADASFPVNNELADSRQRLYFNGRAVFDASFAHGDFTVVLREVNPLDGSPTPALAAWVFAHPNLSRMLSDELNNRFHASILRDPAQAAFVNRVRTVIVKDGQIVMTTAESPAAVAVPINPP